MTTPVRRSLCVAGLLGVLAFWCGLWIAARRYPSEYDWRYITISRLGYADRNPGGYRWAWTGLLLCALGGLCWSTVLVWDCRREKSGRTSIGICALALSYVCMVSCASLPGGFPLFPRGHDILAVSSFLGICIAIIQLTLHLAEGSPRRRRTPPLPGSPRVYAALLAGAALSPILMAAITQAYISRARPDLPWVSLEWRTLGVPVFLSFAFWEWITCAVFSVYTVGLCWMTMMNSSPTARVSPREEGSRIHISQDREHH